MVKDLRAHWEADRGKLAQLQAAAAEADLLKEQNTHLEAQHMAALREGAAIRTLLKVSAGCQVGTLGDTLCCQFRRAAQVQQENIMGLQNQLDEFTESNVVVLSTRRTPALTSVEFAGRELQAAGGIAVLERPVKHEQLFYGDR